MLVPVINQEVAAEQILVVAEDQALFEPFTKMLLDPVEFIRPGRWIIPRGRGHDIDIELLIQEIDGLDGAGYRRSIKANTPGAFFGASA